MATDIVSMMQEKNNDVRKKANQTFIALLALFDKEFVSKKFFSSVKQMAEDLNSDIRLIFVDSICLIGAKLPFKDFEKEILPKFISNLESKHRFIKEKSLSKLGHLICTINEIFIKRKNVVLDSDSIQGKRESNLIGLNQALYGGRSRSISHKEGLVIDEDLSTGKIMGIISDLFWLSECLNIFKISVCIWIML